MSRATLTNAEQEAHLDRYGFVVVPFVNSADLATIREVHTEIGAAPDDPGVAITWSFHSKSYEHKCEIKDRVGPLIAGPIDRLLDRHTVYLTTFITKWPGVHSAFGPHQDPSLVDERRFRGVVVWMPLFATGRNDGVDNGMLHVVPGSHRVHPHLRPQDVNASPLRALDDVLIHEHSVGVPTKAGEAIIFDNRLIHFSPPNQSATARVVLSLGVRADEGKCVSFRAGGPGEMDLFHLDDDYYIEVLPAESHSYKPPLPPVASFPQSTALVTREEFLAVCSTVDQPGGVVPPTPIDQGAQPGVFCHFCGGTDGLDDVSRKGRANAQLVCNRCVQTPSDR